MGYFMARYTFSPLLKQSVLGSLESPACVCESGNSISIRFLQKQHADFLTKPRLFFFDFGLGEKSICNRTRVDSFDSFGFTLQQCHVELFGYWNRILCCVIFIALFGRNPQPIDSRDSEKF
ncbi:hypothetical protein F8M41_017219 [Gigaspora margarita]|uniref:Uncharacterized protein n=1 Tax=Gigaspora margarita TaxID=4874 RepID=A0A8H4EMC0_GIGMA|nr:hypothetical protein F8M41_017219 [Gigaspora margarita]